MKCLAVPIRDYTRRIVGCLSISGPASRIIDERIENKLAPLLTQAGREVSFRLGYEVGLMVGGGN